MPEKPKTNRILELDALRALAAINLLLFHFTLVFENRYGYAGALGFEFPYGKYGVQLFFMLSGFVNAMTLLKKRDPTEFIVSRFIRILPSYWLLILLNAFLLSTFAMYAAEPTLSQLAANATVMPRLLGFECWEPVTWTLQIELIFYAVLMVLFMGGALNRPLRTVYFLLGISGMGMLYVHRLGVLYPGSTAAGLGEFLASLFILKYLPLFTMGILLHEITSQRGSTVLNSVGILASAVVFHVIDDHGHNPVATVLLFALLALSACGRIPLLRCKPLMVVSASSYALYLFHNNLGCLLIKYVNDVGLSSQISFALGIVFTFAFAIAYTFWFEQPLTQRLRRTWRNWKKRTARPTETPTTQLVNNEYPDCPKLDPV